MKYKLSVSHDCGCSYRVEKESDNLEELRKEGQKLDEQMLRWSIEDERGEPVECCGIHKEIIGFMGAVRKRKIEKVDWHEKKHELFVDCEELIREIQERLLWWVEARNRARELMLWALKRSSKNFCTTFELLREAYKEIGDELERLKKVRDLQFQVWRVETTMRINLRLPGDRRKKNEKTN